MTLKEKAQVNSAISTLKEFCQKHENCAGCELRGYIGCKLMTAPFNWEQVQEKTK